MMNASPDVNMQVRKIEDEVRKLQSMVRTDLAFAAGTDQHSNMVRLQERVNMMSNALTHVMSFIKAL